MGILMYKNKAGEYFTMNVAKDNKCELRVSPGGRLKKKATKIKHTSLSFFTCFFITVSGIYL